MATPIFSKESLAVFKDKKLLIAIIAVIFVPILYAGMFLWAFWDPYDRLEDIPVAIVNEDKGYEFDGEFLTLGNELVDKLKKDPEFDFHFVDKKKGYKGLEDEDYYILIEVPEDFSKSSTTLMDDIPKKVKLIYKPNESYNFLASQIGETAMLHIEMALEEKITETYAETIFEKIGEVADGLAEASEATDELYDGAGELKDGSEKIKDNLWTLASKSLEFTDGVSTARAGSNDLAKGANQLADGVSQLNSGSGKLLNASKEVQSGANQLAQGTEKAKSGMEEMRNNIPTLIDGTNQVQVGMKEFQAKLPKQMAGEIGKELEKSSKAMNDGLEELEQGIVGGIENGLKNDMAPQLSEGLTDQLTIALSDGLSKDLSIGISQQISEQIINEQQTQMAEFFQAMEANGVINEEQKSIMLTQLTQNSLTAEQLANKLQPSMQEGIKSSLVHGLPGKIGPGIEAGINGAVEQTINSINPKITAGFDTYKSEVDKGFSGATSGLEKEISNAVNPAFDQLNEGLSAINNGQKQLQGGVTQLADGTKQLYEGSTNLSTGQDKYVRNMQLFTSRFSEVNHGTNELASGANKLLDGMFTLEDGSIQLSDGSKKLADGSKELDEGMNKLVDGTKEFNDNMQEAANEASDVNATEETHNMMANPVQVDNEKINEVPNYGTGFAPYFLSLGLYVGALLLSIVYPLREPSVIPSSGFHWFLRKFIGLFTIGVFQALIASVVLLVGLGIEVQSIPLFILFSIITSLVFITLIQFLVTCFDDPGRFMAIIILILQLTTSAGTFPLELIPEALQPLNALLPMTYTVNGFKAVISSGHFNVMWINAGILIGFTIVFTLLTWSYFTVMFKRKFATMQNEY